MQGLSQARGHIKRIKQETHGQTEVYEVGRSGLTQPASSTRSAIGRWTWKQLLPLIAKRPVAMPASPKAPSHARASCAVLYLPEEPHRRGTTSASLQSLLFKWGGTGAGGMPTTPEEGAPEGRPSPLHLKRTEIFSKMGFDEIDADLLASSDVSVDATRDLIAHGCSHELVIRICL